MPFGVSEAVFGAEAPFHNALKQLIPAIEQNAHNLSLEAKIAMSFSKDVTEGILICIRFHTFY